MRVRYINSENESIELNHANIKLRRADFFTYRWDIEKGDDGRWKPYKKEKEYEAEMEIIGNRKEKIEKMNNFFSVAEKDILKEKPGKLYVDDQYIECYIIGSESKPAESPIGISKKIYIFAQTSWIRENNTKFYSYETSSHNNKIYPGKYTYRYANGMTSAYVINEHFYEANFIMRIYGPVANPQVSIGEHAYLVNIVLEDGEYLEIDSRSGTIKKYMLNGTCVDAFHNRQKGKPFFKKIQPGRQSVIWTGKFNFDLIILEERSEPKW